MNINENLFYAGMLTQEQKESLYTNDSNLASLVIGIHRVSDKELFVGNISTHETAAIEVYMLNSSGFPVILIGKYNDGDYYIQNMLVEYKKVGTLKKTISSKNPNRLVRLMKLKLLRHNMIKVTEEYLDRTPRSVRSRYEVEMHFDADYSGKLTGIEQFELLKVLLANKPTSDISDVTRIHWADAYNKYVTQETKVNESRAELSEIFNKEIWAIYNSELGFVVGTVRYDVSTKRFIQVMPHHLYSSIEAIPDKNVRDELMTTLIMCRTNRDQDPALTDVVYKNYNKDRLIPIANRAYLNTQSGSASLHGETGIFYMDLFMVPR